MDGTRIAGASRPDAMADILASLAGDEASSDSGGPAATGPEGSGVVRSIAVTVVMAGMVDVRLASRRVHAFGTWRGCLALRARAEGDAQREAVRRHLEEAVRALATTSDRLAAEATIHALLDPGHGDALRSAVARTFGEARAIGVTAIEADGRTHGPTGGSGGA